MSSLMVKAFIVLQIVALSACAQSAHQKQVRTLPYDEIVPAELRSQVDRSLSFAQVKAAPSSFEGRMMMVGGEVLNAKRLQNGTRLEVLQLPLNNRFIPTLDNRRSQGRFFAFKKEFLDPATVPTGTLVTLVGEVEGSTTQKLDEVE